MEFLLIFIVSVVIGCLIGNAKGQFASGLVLSLLLGPLGVLIVLCLPNLTKQKEEEERKQQLALQLELQQAQLQKLDQMQRAAPPPGYEPKLRVASNGQDLGEMPVATVRLMLKSGKLAQQDYYFDASANDWIPLDRCPDLV
jgi:hypothetical protein